MFYNVFMRRVKNAVKSSLGRVFGRPSLISIRFEVIKINSERDIVSTSSRRSPFAIFGLSGAQRHNRDEGKARKNPVKTCCISFAAGVGVRPAVIYVANITLRPSSQKTLFLSKKVRESRSDFASTPLVTSRGLCVQTRYIWKWGTVWPI